MGLILPRWGLILPEHHLQPLFFTQPSLCGVTHPFWGYPCTKIIPKSTPKHPVSEPELESGQNELQSGQPGPLLGKMFEKWTSRSGQKKNIIHTHKCSTAAVNKHGIRVNMHGGKLAPLSFTLFPTRTQSEQVHTKAYYAIWRALLALSAVRTCCSCECCRCSPIYFPTRL